MFMVSEVSSICIPTLPFKQHFPHELLWDSGTSDISNTVHTSSKAKDTTKLVYCDLAFV